MRPDVNHLVVASCQQEPAIGCEAEDIAGADAATGFDDNLRLIPGAAIELLGVRVVRSQRGEHDQ